MDLTKYYPDIAAKYPAYVTQRELCEICRICPKTAYNLEQQGEIPYTIEQNHLIRSHKIKLTDILAYLYRRECRQEADSPYTIDGIDCYLTNEPDKAYQFIIYDCGVMQTPTSIFRDAEHRLLCGSVLPYEIPVFHKALSECGSLEVRPVAICVPQEIQEYCTELFGEDVQIAAASHDLFAKQVNGQIYRPLVEKYIAGEKRL